MRTTTSLPAAASRSLCFKINDAKRLALVLVLFSAFGSANANELVWIGGTGNWDVAANWSPVQVPTAADNTYITNTGTYTVSVPNSVNPTVASLTLGGASGTQTLSLGRSILTLNGASVVNPNGQLTLTVGNSTVTGAGNLTIDGTLNWASGTISGAGTTIIGSNGAAMINGGVTLTTRTFNNAGHVSWDSGNFTIGSGAAINNLGGGTFDITFDSRLSVATAPGTFSNTGWLRKTAGTGIANLILPFNNAGIVQSQSGTLSLDNGGTHTGSFSNATGATLNFGGGSHVLSAGTIVTGAGVLAMSGNATTLNASGGFDAGATLNVTAGVATLSAGCNVAAATLVVSGGTLNFNTSSPVGVMNVTSGTLGGTSPVNVTGLLTLNGGTVTSALVTANGGLNITGGVTLNGGKLVNVGTAIWSAGNFTGANGAVFSNLLGATFINTFDGNAPSGAGATPTFVNAGTFAKTNGTAPLGTTSIDFTFLNTGTVEVQTNTLRYTVNQQTAGLTILDGGGLSAQNPQSLQFLGGSLVGTGPVTVANTANVINSASISPGTPLGELDIAGNYQQTGGGTLNIELGGYVPGTDFDLVAVAAGGAGGVATLNGTLNVAFANGFSPTNGATFTFLTANSRAGAFSTFNYPSNDVGMQVILGAGSASVKVINLKPVVANPIADPAPVTYGAAFNLQFASNTFSDPDNDALSYTAAGMPAGVTFDNATRTFSGTPTETGVFPVTVFAKDNGTPSLSTTNTFTLTVNPAPLSITADAQVKIYGAPDPELTYAVTGLQFTDTPTTVLTGTLARVTGETVAGSPYAITQGTLVASPNYAISFTNNTLTISKAALSVSAENKTKVYGAADPAFTVSYSGFVNSETPAVLGGTLGLTRAPGSNVGNYLVTPNGLTSGNYNITFNSGTLAITPAALTVTANAKSKTYGTLLTLNGATDFTPSGLLNGEAIGSVTLLASGSPLGTATNAAAGPYTITPSGATGGTFNPTNYSITYATGALTVNQAALSVTADAKTKVYGEADPAFTVTYSGFVNGESSTVLAGTLSLIRDTGETVGSYLITPSALTSGNYNLTFNTGTFSITKAVLSITADARTKSYGAPDPALTFAAGGFQFTDTQASVLTGVLTRAAGETVAGSPYAISQGTLAANGNYTVSFTGNSLSITTAALTITAQARTKTYGATLMLNGTTDFNSSGLQNSETIGSVTLTASGSPAGTAAAAAADSYTITPSAATGGTFNPANYSINYATGALTVNQAALSVTADAKTKTAGAADPLFTASYDGFVNGETPVALGGTLGFTRAPGESVGNYLITPGGLTSGNYAINFNPGTLTITAPAPQLLPLTLNGSNVVISWNAVSNGSYRIQYQPALNATNWIDLPGDVTATNGIASKTDIRTATNRFYRAQVLP